MNNPFQVLEERLSIIESLILEIKLMPQQGEPSEELLTVQQAADFLSLTVPSIYGKVSKGELPVMKRSKRLYFSKLELINYLKKGRRKTNEEIKEQAGQFLIDKKGGKNA